MKLTTRYKPKTNFDMSSATDIMFLLLIFFMIAFSSAPQRSIEVNLPSSTTSENTTPQICLTIDADMQFFVEDKLIDKTKLKSILKNKLNLTNNNLMLYTNKHVPVETIIYVADIASSLGVKMAIATTPSVQNTLKR